MKKLAPVDYWRIGLGASVVLGLLMGGGIWISGSSETPEAMKNGQRLLITIATGAIEGAQAPSEHQEKKPEEADKGKDKEKTAESPPAAASAVAEKAPDTDKNPEESPATAVKEENKPAAEKLPADSAVTATKAASSGAAEGPRIAGNSLAAVSESLSDALASGTVPKISTEGQKPWRYYAKSYVHKGHLPMIAIVVTGLGQNKSVADMAVKLPENFSLSFSPYAKDTGIWINSARIAGHEVLLDLPLEPSNYPATDPGPYGLLVGIGNQANLTRLDWLMSRAQGYIGFLTPQNDVFSANAEAFKALLSALNKRGLMMLMGHEPAKGETTDLLSTSNMAYGIGDILIDEDLSNTSIQSRLVSLEKLAAKRGYAIGIAQAFPLTLQQLDEWSQKLEKEGVELAPVSFIIGLKFPN